MTLTNQIRRRRRRGEAGFTLIELLVVIAILGVLAGVVIFNVNGVADRGSLAACKGDVSTVQLAVDAYRDNSATGHPAGDMNPDGTPGKPPTMAQLVSGAYLHSTPAACGSYSIDGTTGSVSAIAKDGKTHVP